MDTPTYDVIVIGAGPAGLTTATEAARGGLKVFCLDKLAPGGALINLGELHDIEELSNGPDFASRMTDDATVAGVELGFGEVSSVAGTGPFEIETTDGEKHTGRAIVVATGLNKGKLGLAQRGRVRRSRHLALRPLRRAAFAGLPVIVAGAGGWADLEARELVGVASEITMIDARPGDALADVQRMEGRIVGLDGSDGLQSVTVETAGQRKTIPTSAVFVYVGQSPAAEFLPDSLARDASGHIVVDAEGRTSMPTVFAAGDVRAGARYYLSDAIADGQRAAQSVVSALKKS